MEVLISKEYVLPLIVIRVKSYHGYDAIKPHNRELDMEKRIDIIMTAVLLCSVPLRVHPLNQKDYFSLCLQKFRSLLVRLALWTLYYGLCTMDSAPKCHHLCSAI